MYKFDQNWNLIIILRNYGRKNEKEHIIRWYLNTRKRCNNKQGVGIIENSVGCFHSEKINMSD